MKKCLLLELLEDGVARSAQDVMNFVDLVEFVIPGEEWEEGQDFKVDAADSPVVHLVIIVAVREKAFRWPVPSGRDVFCEGRLRVDTTARPEVSELHLVVLDQNVLAKKVK